MRRAWALALLGLAACEGPAFDEPSLVRGARVLAAIAEPPDAAPGEDVTLRALTALAPGATVEWSLDASPAALALWAGQTLFEAGSPEALPEGRLDGARTQASIDALYARVGDAPPGTPEHVVRLVYEEVGLVLFATFVVRDADGGLIAEGHKRIGLSPRAERTTNPPPPRVRVGERWASARAGDPAACTPEDAPLEARAGEVIVLAPDPDEGWLESYPALDLAGRPIRGMENAYYSWFATAGRFRFSVTRAPERDVEWTAPDVPGDVALWLVVRDGHLGVSACALTIRVVP
ncbi:MAG: hypothetical protein KF729_27805 [Sandaracinaceae bacterium]|nr:hypothetical protein [Sandaracinaceae bacterium]